MVNRSNVVEMDGCDDKKNPFRHTIPYREGPTVTMHVEESDKTLVSHLFTVLSF